MERAWLHDDGIHAKARFADEFVGFVVGRALDLHADIVHGENPSGDLEADLLLAVGKRRSR